MTSVSPILKVTPKNEDVKTGLAENYQEDMAKRLSQIVSESYKLMIKNHVYHWNVVGPLFKPLHELTEDHYQDLFTAIDVLAERIRALGSTAPFNMEDASKFAPKSKDIQAGTAIEMVDDLISANEKISRTMRDAAAMAGDNKDMVTEDLLTGRLAFHEQAVWMLRATASK
ncbi:Dps family protein [Maritalea sp.]|uniref:Dps family protein n=1 Tax=Maritalea sp. TaxID=2003361 RepID=UPI003EF74E70